MRVTLWKRKDDGLLRFDIARKYRREVYACRNKSLDVVDSPASHRVCEDLSTG